jgi:hypothetical protein
MRSEMQVEVLDVIYYVLVSCLEAMLYVCRIQGDGYRNNIELPSIHGPNSISMLVIDYTPPICLLITHDSRVSSKYYASIKSTMSSSASLSSFALAMNGCRSASSAVIRFAGLHSSSRYRN